MYLVLPTIKVFSFYTHAYSRQLEVFASWCSSDCVVVHFVPCTMTPSNLSERFLLIRNSAHLTVVLHSLPHPFLFSSLTSTTIMIQAAKVLEQRSHLVAGI